MAEEQEQKGRQVLYRKWRSADFSEIVGQKHVVRTLKNALASGRLASAYLFSGPRGTGKTSMARILAKVINCLSPKDGQPCNKCENCVSINNGSFMDVIEMDAASHTQVDKIREFIVEKVNFRPVKGKKKVYIIDEVHKLSAFSFDALLKTIEEPPPFVIFILATTEPEKLPPTILSRCQRFDFKRIPVTQIIERLREISDAEGFKVEEGALNLIAQSSEGALRDALVILQQAVSFSEDWVTAGDVISLLGMTGIESLFTFGDVVLEKDSKRGLEFIDEMYREGRDLQRLAVDLLEHFRRLLLIRIVRDAEVILEITDELYQRLTEQSFRFKKPAHLMHIIKELIELRKNLKETGMERLLWEMTVIKLTRWEVSPTLDGLYRRLNELEAAMGSGQPLPKAASAPAPAAPPAPVRTPAPRQAPPPQSRPKLFTPPPPPEDDIPDPEPPPEDDDYGSFTPPPAPMQRSKPAPRPAPKPRTERPVQVRKPPVEEPVKEPPSPQETVNLNDGAVWHKLLRSVQKEKFYIVPVLQETGAGKIQGKDYVFKVDSSQPFNKDILEKHRNYLENVLHKLTGHKLRVRFETTGNSLFDTQEIPLEKPHSVFVQEVQDKFDASPVD